MKNEIHLLKLKSEINKRIKIATDSLLKNDTITAKENIEWVEFATNLIDKTQRKPDKIRLALTIGLLSVLLLGLGLTIKMNKINISVDIVTKNFNFTLKKDWIISNRIYSSELTINDLKEFNGRNVNYKVPNAYLGNTMDLKGKNIVITDLTLSSNSEVTIQLLSNTQNLLIKNDSLSAKLQVDTAHLNITNGQGDTVLHSDMNFEMELYQVKSFASGGLSNSIILSDTAGLVLRDILISDIKFSEENPPGSGKFISSIISGNLKILEIEKDVRLEEGDWLLLDSLKDRRIQISKLNSDLKIHIEGEVSKARAGSELFEKNLNPTILEYLYYAKSSAFFWSCLVFIWSFIWSLKNTLFSK